MRKELCYRIETEDGVGMYNCAKTDIYGYGEFAYVLNDKCYSVCSDHWTLESPHPAPSIDTKLNWAEHHGKRWLFGFSNMEQLRRWFFDAELIEKMQDYGLAVSIFECEEYSIGDTQMIFNPNKSNKIGRFVLTA